MSEKMETKLPGMLMAWLMINPQVESAKENLMTLLRMMPDETKEKLFASVREDLTSRMEAQVVAIKEQIGSMEV
ncbi:MAG: hypothetical protein GY906_02330 [bacterium]|nr:hypothetical protein [bacterium]